MLPLQILVDSVLLPAYSASCRRPCSRLGVRNLDVTKFGVDPTKLRQNLCVFWKLMNPQECVWEIRYRIIMKTIIAGKGENSLQHYNLVHKFIPMPQAMKIPAAKAAVDKEWEKLEKFLGVELDKSQK